MPLGTGVRKTCIFFLVFVGFVPRAFAATASCLTGWEWVSDSLDLSILGVFDSPRATELICALYPGQQLDESKPLRDRWSAGSSMPGIQCVQIDIPPPRQVRNSRPTAWFTLGPLASGQNYQAPQLNSSSQKCECNTVMYRYRAYFTCTPQMSANL